MKNEIARPGARAPWWIYFFGAAFLAYFAVMVYSERWAPRRIGFDYDFTTQGMVISRVDTNSAAGRAGLRPDDHVLAIAGRRISGRADWEIFADTREMGVPYRVDLDRDRQPQRVWLTLGRQAGDSWLPLERKRYVQAVVLALAFALAFRRPCDTAARIGAWMLAAVGTAGLFPGDEMTAVWRHLPLPLGALLWIPQITHFVLLPLVFTFHAVMPRAVFRKRWPWLIVWVPALLALGWGASGWGVLYLFREIYHPPQVAGVPAWLNFVMGLGILGYGVGGLAALLVNYRRLTDPSDRRRMRVLTVGSIIGWLPGLLFLTAMFWGPLTTSPLVWFFVSTPYRLFALAMSTIIPLSLAYGVLRDRVFDIRTARGADAGAW